MATLLERSTVYSTIRTRQPASARLLSAFVIAYIFLDWLSYLHPLEPFRVTPWNPQAALAVALMMLYGKRHLPIVTATILAADLLLRWSLDEVLVALAGSVILSLGYAAIAGILSISPAVRPQLDDRKDLLRLIAVVAVGAFVTGVLYIGSRLAGGIGTPQEFPRALLSYWIGDSVGIIVTLPLLLMLSDATRWRQCRDLLLRWESAAQAATTIAALWFVFGRDSASDFHSLYWLFVPLVWMAGRSGMIGAVIAVSVIQGGVILGLYIAPNPAFDVFELQALLIALSVTGFFVGATVDERLRAAYELRQSLKLAAVAEMAAAVAHELNQPLTAMMSYAKASQLLAEGLDGKRTELVDTLGKLSSEAKRAADVVRRLREFFAAGLTRRERVSLESVVDIVVASLGTRLVTGSVSVHRRIEGVLPPLTLDPLQIEVVLRNLLSNAFDAAASMPLGERQIAVEMRAGDGEVRVRILDSGPGINVEKAERVFEPFMTSKAAGMGLGLPLSRAVIEAHGGMLWVVPGERGEICFTLPVEIPGHA